MRFATCVTAVLLLACAVSAKAADLSGFWEERRGGDQLTLELQVRGNAVCGRVMGTSHRAAHIDHSGVVGVRRGDTLALVFSSLQAAHPTARATASVRLVGRKLRWRLTQQIAGSDLWSEARLQRQPVDKDAAAALSVWCADRWAQIAEGNLQRIDVKID